MLGEPPEQSCVPNFWGQNISPLCSDPAPAFPQCDQPGLNTTEDKAMSTSAPYSHCPGGSTTLLQVLFSGYEEPAPTGFPISGPLPPQL